MFGQATNLEPATTYIFTAPELARLAAYRDAVVAGLYSDHFKPLSVRRAHQVRLLDEVEGDYAPSA